MRCGIAPAAGGEASGSAGGGGGGDGGGCVDAVAALMLLPLLSSGLRRCTFPFLFFPTSAPTAIGISPMEMADRKLAAPFLRHEALLTGMLLPSSIRVAFLSGCAIIKNGKSFFDCCRPTIEMMLFVDTCPRQERSAPCVMAYISPSIKPVWTSR
jgi:hypothetical protein